jgi:hypothetical protein
MAVAERPWTAREDRRGAIFWLTLLWIGLVAGFGVDLPRFLKERPAAPLIIDIHAICMIAWLAVLTAQVALVETRRIALHRKLGLWAGGLAILVVVVSGPAAVSSIKVGLGQPGFVPQFLALNLVDVVGFAAFIGAGFAYRHDPAAHRRLMALAAVSVADPGFARLSGAFLPEGTTIWSWFVLTFWGNLLMLALLVGLDLTRRGRVHPALAIGATLTLAGELGGAALFFNPTWGAWCATLVKVWPLT